MFLLKVSEGKLAILLFALILTETNYWELLGKQHSTFPSIRETAKHFMCQWVISHCEGSQCLYCRQTLGWPYQFLEHRPCCQSRIPALLSSASPQQPVLCSWNSLPTQAGRIHLQSVTGPLGMSVSHSPRCLFSAQVLHSLLTEANCKSTIPLQPDTHDCSCHRWSLLQRACVVSILSGEHRKSVLALAVLVLYEGATSNRRAALDYTNDCYLT